VIAILHEWPPPDVTQADVADLARLLARLIEQQIAAAVAVKEERVFAHVVQWALAFICHDRQGEHNAMRALARECGGDIPPFREIPDHK
jgi:hypothetical protein